MTVEEVKKAAKLYFDVNPNLQRIFITDDNHAWYEEFHAAKYCKNHPGVSYTIFTKGDFVKKPVKKVETKVSEPVKAEVKEPENKEVSKEKEEKPTVKQAKK